VISSDPQRLNRFRLLATFIAGRAVDVAEAAVGVLGHTDSQVVFVSPGASSAEQRREVVLQSALLDARSLDHRLVMALRGRPSVARRYLAIEGHRVLAELSTTLPLAAALRLQGNRKPRPPRSRSRWQVPERKSLIRQNGSESSNPPEYSRHRQVLARSHEATFCTWNALPLLRALAAAAAEDPHDGEALYRQLTGPQHRAVIRRLQHGSDVGQIRRDADLEAVADALIGAVLYRTLTRTATAGDDVQHFDGLIDVLITGMQPSTHPRGDHRER
jgi:hypothetical protein